jgi:hypothetical protein
MTDLLLYKFEFALDVEVAAVGVLFDGDFTSAAKEFISAMSWCSKSFLLSDGPAVMSLTSTV